MATKKANKKVEKKEVSRKTLSKPRNNLLLRNVRLRQKLVKKDSVTFPKVRGLIPNK